MTLMWLERNLLFHTIFLYFLFLIAAYFCLEPNVSDSGIVLLSTIFVMLQKFANSVRHDYKGLYIQQFYLMGQGLLPFTLAIFSANSIASILLFVLCSAVSFSILPHLYVTDVVSYGFFLLNGLMLIGIFEALWLFAQSLTLEDNKATTALILLPFFLPYIIISSVTIAEQGYVFVLISLALVLIPTVLYITSHALINTLVR